MHRGYVKTQDGYHDVCWHDGTYRLSFRDENERLAFLNWALVSRVTRPAPGDVANFTRDYALAMQIPRVYRDAILIYYWQVSRTRAIVFLYKDWGQASLAQASAMVDALVRVSLPCPVAVVVDGGVS